MIARALSLVVLGLAAAALTPARANAAVELCNFTGGKLAVAVATQKGLGVLSPTKKVRSWGTVKVDECVTLTNAGGLAERVNLAIFYADPKHDNKLRKLSWDDTPVLNIKPTKGIRTHTRPAFCLSPQSVDFTAAPLGDDARCPSGSRRVSFDFGLYLTAQDRFGSFNVFNANKTASDSGLVVCNTMTCRN